MKKFFTLETSDGVYSVYESVYDAFLDVLRTMTRWAEHQEESCFTVEDYISCVKEIINSFDLKTGFVVDDLFWCYPCEFITRREEISNE